MGVNSVLIRNFQSLKSVDLELGTFTVIVGPSSSGKSALIRAFRALAGNVRGNGMITRGQKNMTISVRTDTHIVTLERSDRQGLYRLLSNEGEQVFTKLAGEVPQQITDALRLDETVNFANQFDKPFLLDESGATVARQLGELTNVNLIFEAVRQANRIRASAASTLKTRHSDLEALRAKVGQYQDLPAKLKLMAQAEALDATRFALQGRISRLSAAIRAVQLAEKTAAKSTLVPLPDTSAFETTLQRAQQLQNRLDRLRDAEDNLWEHGAALEAAQRAATQADEDFHAGLHRAGVCPTCGQATR